VTDLAARNGSLAADALNLVELVTEGMGDVERPLEDRGAFYAIGQQLRLKLDRALKGSRDDLIVGMERAGLKSMGPLTIRSAAVDPSYPCNAPENWDDADVQDTMEALAQDPNTRAYVRLIPAHREIAVDVLAQDVQLGVQAAQLLYRELNRKGWRTEQARRLSLAVREPRKGT
jgi:hypothetical protein